jgi:malate dehydrogenase (oxaloacetate-decarboxylating)
MENIKQKAMELHEKLKGKMFMGEKMPMDFDSLKLLYTPGVAEPCLEVAKNPERAYDLTWKWNSVGVISDGSRVLGLGNIGPTAAMPLLEGKAMIFSKFGNLDAVPIAISQGSVDETVKTIKSIHHGFGGINLEDISVPKCYDILDRLIEELDIPVWHDDQQGTATVIVAALLNALEVTGRKLSNANLLLYGSGAANTAVYRLLKHSGVDPKQFTVFNSKGILGSHRKDLMDVPVLKMICDETNPSGKNTSIEDALKSTDVIIALSTPGPNVIKPEWIKAMKKDPIVFACANPTPEIEPRLAKEAGAAIVATGRSDYPNQANNALVFPGMFRGALDVRAKKITWSMAFAVAKEIALMAKEKGLTPDYIVPRIDEPLLHTRVAKITALTAIKEGMARVTFDDNKIRTIVEEHIKHMQR